MAAAYSMAGKARVHELAKELGVTSKEILAQLLPVTLDDDDGVIEIDDAVRVAGWQGDVVLGSVT